MKAKEQFPWMDKKLNELRDFFFFESKASTNDLDHEKNLLLYKQHRAEYQTLNRIKMIEHFAMKSSKEFKNSEKSISKLFGNTSTPKVNHQVSSFGIITESSLIENLA